MPKHYFLTLFIFIFREKNNASAMLTVSNNYLTDAMTIIKRTEIFIARNLFVLLMTFKITSSTGQVTEKSDNIIIENDVNTQAHILNQSTTFPQIHTNLNGMVREFVRTMYQDKKGNYWFGTNGNGIIRYDGQTLQKFQSKDSAH